MRKVRVLRLLEYYGDPEWIEKTFAKNAVKQIHRCGDGNEIRECMVGQLPIPLSVGERCLIEAEAEAIEQTIITREG
jgi:hypothetical protein